MNLFARRVPTLLGLLLLGGLIYLGYFLIQSRQVATSPEVTPQKVRITNISDNKFSVTWITATPQIGAVEYGKLGEALSKKALDERDTTTSDKYVTHQVTLSELQPNTQYSFRILSGEKLARFDNSGTPYTTSTGPVIANTPPAKSFYGTVKPGSISSSEGALVYITLPGSAPVSTLVKSTGTYTISISTIRTADLKAYVNYDPSATVVSASIESGKEQSSVSVSTANMAPVPDITLGQNADFRTLGDTPAIAEVQSGSPLPSPTSAASLPQIFNVEPLSTSSVNEVTNTGFTILNPATEGETITTLRPEFRGSAPPGVTLSVALTGQKAISDTTTSDSDGTWTWSPVIDLKTGKQTITVSYTASGGTAQKISKGFVISTSKTSNDPAFVSSPSASVKASASATPKPATSSSSTRTTMPATESGVPTTGVLGPTMFTAIVGIIVTLIGAVLFVI